MISRKTTLAFVCGIAVQSACGGGHATSPIAPATPTSNIVVTTTSVPLVAVPESSNPARFRTTAELVFKETAGRPARVTRMRVTVASPRGWSTTVSTDTDLAIAALGTASYTLTTLVEATGPNQSAQWRLTATVVDQGGQTLETAPFETELRFPATQQAPDEIFVGAGDIARCDDPNTEATAKLLDRIPGSVFTLGDNVYPTSTPELLATCYESTWGRHKRRTLATPGNHDWEQSAGMPYFAYFGPGAGPAGLGYYSVTLGSWHVVSLNSNVPAGPGSPQYEWLKADLEESAATCTLAMWHHPLFSSGPNGNNAQMREIWRLLNRYGAELVLSGHDHGYERFAPQDADGRSSPAGMRQFVVGTGGYSLYDRVRPQPNAEAWDNRTWGVIKLRLKSGSYDWEFVPIDGQSFRDFGSAACTAPSN